MLARNFRSHTEILSAAARSIANNPGRVPKALIAMRGPGGQAQAIGFSSEREEAWWIASTVAGELADGTPPAEILVLARTGYASGPVQTALAGAGIPHRVLGSLGLYERSEVRDALAYLTLIANPCDAQAFRRAVGAPRRGIGERTAGQVVARARERHGGDLIAASATATLTEIGTAKAREQLERFGIGLERARAELEAGRSLGHVAITAVMLPGGLVAHYQALIDQCPDPQRRRDAERVLEDLRSLCRAVQAYEQRDPSPPSAGSSSTPGDCTPASCPRRGGPANHAIDDPPRQGHRGAGGDPGRLRGTAAAVVAGARDPRARGGTPPVLRRVHAPKDRLYITHAATRGGRDTARALPVPGRGSPTGEPAMSARRPETIAAAALEREARIAAQTRPLRHGLRQTERYADLRGQTYPLASMVAPKRCSCSRCSSATPDATPRRARRTPVARRRQRCGRAADSDRGSPPDGFDERGPVAAPDAASPRAQGARQPVRSREAKENTR